jgi:hypothetical protein
VHEADDEVMEEKLAEAKQAVQTAQLAAKSAGEATEKALEHARATKASADRARAAMQNRGAAAEAALSALNAENHARSTVQEATKLSKNLQQESTEARALAEMKRVKRDGEEFVMNKAAKAEEKTSNWYQQTVDQRDATQQLVDDRTAKLEELQQQYDNSVEVERSAADAVPMAEKDADQCKVLHEQAKAALEKVVVARRQAWKSAYKAESGNKELLEAASKVTDIAKEEKEAADKKNGDAAKVESQAQAVVDAKQAKVSEAEEMVAKAKAANDPDSEATAERSVQAAKSALAAATSALTAAQASGNAIRGSTEQSLQLAEKLNKAVLDLGTSDEAEQQAKEMATKSNEMMKKATEATKHTEDLWNEAVDEHKMRIEDKERKIKERKRLERELADAKVELDRTHRYLTRDSELVKTWADKLAEMQGYHGEQRDLYAAAVKAYDEEDEKSKQLEGVTDTQVNKEEVARKTVNDSQDDLTEMAKTAGLDMVAKLMHMRSKWAKLMHEGASRLLKAARLAVSQAKPELVRTTKVEQAALRERDKLQAQQDGAVGSAVAKRKSYHVVWLTKTELQVAANKANVKLQQQLTQAKKESKERLALLEELEKTRREAALSALQLRVESIWKKRQEVHDPDPSRRLEISQFERIIAAWDRDGTPLGPGVLDTWYLDKDTLVESHDGQPGYLKEKVINRCSAACGEYADLECSQGHRFRACTRGIVFRARFKRTQTIKAKSDWFVCRCNTGVMQLASRDVMDVTRKKNQLLKATLLPENMLFDVRLHTEEMLPDNHVHCFRDFEKWLTTETPFSEPRREIFKDLDAIALSPPEDAKAAYLRVRDLWYKTCIREDEPEPLPDGIHIGTTDGSFDMFEMKSQSYSTMDIRKQPAAEAKEDEPEARKE